MKLVYPSYDILFCTDLDLIEASGRTCYKSDMSNDAKKQQEFIASRIHATHESILEHSILSVKFICDRGVSHELVRHRLCAFSQESTRYCNYSGGVTFIIPPWVDIEPGTYSCPATYVEKTAGIVWLQSMLEAEEKYIELLNLNWNPQHARSVLPNSLKTEIIVTSNFREWRHILKLRTEKAAHPQMRELMQPLLLELKDIVPVIFDDIVY